MNNKIIVYGLTKERAYDKLQEIIDKTPYGEVSRVIKGNTRFEMIKKNGDMYLAAMASDNCRGYKWQFAYIDTMVDKDIINRVILPAFVPSHELLDYVDAVEWF